MTEQIPRPPYSLRTRLLLWLLVPLVAIGLLALFDSYRSARETADEIADRVLAGSALAIAERIFVNDDGLLEVDIPYVALEMLTSSEEDRVFYRIEGGGSEFITGYRQLSVPEEFDRSERNLRFADGRFREAPIRMAVLNDAAASDTISLAYRVIIAETTNARNKMARDILLRSALRQGLLIITAAFIVWFAVTRSLRPLYRLQEAVGRRSPDDLRPIEHRVPGEVSGLVATINDLVRRFGSSISTLRNFTSNASHQLRTPLTVMRTQLELASRAKTDAARDAALRETDNAIGEAERVLSQLLLLARIDSTAQKGLASHRCDIATISREICEDLIAGSLPADIDLGYDGPAPVEIAGDEVLTRELMRNVIDNAIVHGGRPIEITVRVRVQGQQVAVEVEDNGAGIDPDQFDTVLNRFQRGTGGSEGSGLGLAIAKEIVELFGGSLALDTPAKHSGLLVRMLFRTS
ncbi:sensor histidine kinase N-terminal domain-containing protein [Hoeflea sp.]|uniref:sensor histidine kinase n=1 Tax=Hoeflea sp. TaxID=1940281 RepID=UPI003B01465A